MKKFFCLTLIILTFYLPVYTAEVPEPSIAINGTLYLTGPDTGRILFFNFNNLSMIENIQTKGTPWEIAFDKESEIIYITDFAKDKIYELKRGEKTLYKTIDLETMTGPKDIELSSDGSLAYIIQSLASDFAVFKTGKFEPFVRTKLHPNPSNFAVLKEINLIAITCPGTNRLIFLNASDFSRINQVILDGSPEKIVSDEKRNLFYITNRNSNNLSIVDGNKKKLIKTISVGETPTSLALDSESKWLYVGCGRSNTIEIINLESQNITHKIILPAETQFPGDIIVTDDEKYLIVTSETTNTISVIDLTEKKVVKKVDVGVTTHAAYLVGKSL